MSVTLALHFPWRRYHATPWGHYVNEGVVEVPPSPWRILRALYSVWKLRVPDLDADTVHGLLERLAVPPDYTLPPYRLSHTRHYLPDTKHRTGKTSTDLALDAFAVLGGDATIYVHWSTRLEPAQEQALERLARSLPYLGRADSICDASLRHDRPAGAAMAVPLLDGEVPNGMLQTEVLAPAFPFDIEALTVETRQVRAAKLVYPPGSRLIQYAVPPPEKPRTKPRRRPPRSQKVTTVRYTLKGTPQPRAIDTVAVTDALRAAALDTFGDVLRGPATGSNLVGKDAAGRPLTGHRHAHYLALTEGDRITGLAIWAPGGLTDEELTALDRLVGRTVGVPERVPGPRNLHVRVNAYGDTEVLPEHLVGPSTTWTSITPFVLSRWKPRNADPQEHLIKEIHRELQSRGLPAPTRITRLPGKHWALYRRHRWSPHYRNGSTTKTVGSRNETRPACALRLEFDQPVSGPLALGHLSHFGLGLFRAFDAHT